MPRVNGKYLVNKTLNILEIKFLEISTIQLNQGYCDSQRDFRPGKTSENLISNVLNSGGEMAKVFVVAFLYLSGVFFSGQTFTSKPYTPANTSAVMLPAPASCVCSCGADCSSGRIRCTTHCFSGCTGFECLGCGLACCGNASEQEPKCVECCVN